MDKPGKWSYLGAGLTGVLGALSFPGFGLHFLGWVALVPLFVALEGKRSKDGFRLGFVAGLIYYTAVLHWLLTLTYWVGAVVLIGLALLFVYLALYWAVFGAVVSRLSRKSRVPLWIACPVLWASFEWVQGHIFTGFGWGALGYSQAGNSLVLQWASIGSVYIVSALLVLVNVCVSGLFRRTRGRLISLVGALLVVGAAHLCGWLITPRQPADVQELVIGLVQGSFSQDILWGAEYDKYVIDTHLLISEHVVREGAEFVVWSESGVPTFWVDDSDRCKPVRDFARKHNVYLLTGAASIGEGEPGRQKLYNSSYFIGPSGEVIDRYDKMRLTPFGEYTPMKKYLPFVGKVVTAISDISAGTTQTLFSLDELRFGILICFESAFPDLARGIATRGGNFIVTVTNVNWFGRSMEPQQDLAILKFRAVETRLPVARASNTGISGFLDPAGRLYGEVVRYGQRIFVQGWSVEPVAVWPVFSLYRTVGDVFVIICAVLSIIALLSCLAGRGVPGTGTENE